MVFRRLMSLRLNNAAFALLVGLIVVVGALVLVVGSGG